MAFNPATVMREAEPARASFASPSKMATPAMSWSAALRMRTIQPHVRRSLKT